MKILVAGANGAIGRAVVDLLKEQGHVVRALTRRPGQVEFADEVVIGDALDRSTLRGAANGVDVVVSALGASVGLGLRGRATYEEVDVPANVNLAEAAREAGVGRFVYLGVHSGPGWDHTRYVVAHERVCEHLVEAGFDVTTIRPVGVFTALEEFLTMARRGSAQVIGDGSAKTNPIHPLDVAAAVVANLESGPLDVSVGGPDVLTRRQIAEAAFEALGKPPRVSSVPPGVPRTMAAFLRPFHPRLGDLITFAVEVSTHDCVAPVAGTRRLIDYFRAQAGAMVATR